jgi:hypothetical protein
MRIHRLSHIGALLLGLVLPAALVGQEPVPDYLVRVTLRDSWGGHPLVGHLMSVSPDSLVLRVFDSETVVKIDRSTVLRTERRVDGSLGKAMLAGCLAVGGVLALLGSQVHDADSPGIGTVAAVVGGVFGCLLGALGGSAITPVNERDRWEEVTICDPIGSRIPLPNQRCS